jgi:K+/H+ antiporter YhaU regulatory subunit KhtT
MADIVKVNFKKFGMGTTVVTVGLMVLGLAVGCGRAYSTLEGNIKGVTENQKEDREVVKEIALMLKELKKVQIFDYRELKQEDNDAKVRYERTATQYATILSHMTQQTSSSASTVKSISDLKVEVGKIQTKVESLFKDSN